jgi:hypothetical protein
MSNIVKINKQNALDSGKLFVVKCKKHGIKRAKYAKDILLQKYLFNAW